MVTETHKKQTSSLITEKGKYLKLSILQKFSQFLEHRDGFSGVRGEVHFNQIKILIKNNNNKKKNV